MKTIEKIYMIIICVNIALLNLLVGSSHTDPRFALNALIFLETLVYIIIQKIHKKNNIVIKSKIDIALILFTISTVLPLIFKTYVSEWYTINMCLMQVTAYCMYILVRNIVTTPKRKSILINTTLISSVIIVIFGLDELHFDTFRTFLDIIYSAKSDAYGMVSTLGYSNAVAAYMIFMLFLALGKYLESKNEIKKNLYTVSIEISMIGFYYGKSRAGMVIFALILIPYVISLKEHEKRIETIFQIVLSYILTFIFDKIIGIYTNEWLLWIQFVLILVTNYIINYIIGILMQKEKIREILKKRPSKKYIIISTIAILTIFIIFVSIAGKYSSPIVIDEENYIIDLERVIKPNSHHQITIEYEAEINKKNTMEKDKIIINEKNIYRKENEIGTIYLKDGKNSDTIDVQTSDMDIEVGRMHIKKKKKDKLTINKIYVDGKEYIDNYKYVPTSLMTLLKTLNFKTLSVSERLIMYKDSLKLVKRSPIIGSGGKAFSCLYQTVRSYNYAALEDHNYIIDVLLDYGIFGLACYIIILSITIKNYVNSKKTMLNLSIFTGFIFVTIHTIFDFDLAYMLTLANYFIFIAILNENDKEIKTSRIDKLISNILCVVFIFISIFNIRCMYGKYLEEKEKYDSAIKYYPYSKIIKEEIIMQNNDDELIKKYLKTEKNGNQLEMCKKLYIDTRKEYEKGEKEIAKENLNLLYNELVYNNRTSRYSVREIVDEGKLISSIITVIENIEESDDDENLNEMIKGFAKKFLNKYDQNVSEIKEIDKNLFDDDKIESQLKAYNDIYNQMIMYSNKYK